MQIKDYPFYYFKKKTFGVFVLKVFNGLLPTIQVMATAAFLDRCIFYITEKQGLPELGQALFGLLLTMALNWVLVEVIHLALVELEIDLYEKSRELVLEKITRMKYFFLEDKEHYEQIQRMMRNPEILWKNSFLALCDSIALAVKIISLLVYIGLHASGSAAVMIVFLIPMAFRAFQGGSKIYHSNVEAQVWQNKSEYSYELLTEKASARERSLFGYFDMVQRQWMENYRKYSDIQAAGEKFFSYRC